MSALARRYARAVVEAAQEKGGKKAVEELSEGLQSFRKVYDQSTELHELVQNPSFKSQRDETLREVTKELSTFASTLIRLLSENERMGLLSDVVEQVEQIGDEAAGRQRARVTTAVELTQAQQKRIATALSTRLGEPVVLQVEVDPEILGGLVCRVGDLTIDSSLKHQLNVVRERLASSS